MRLAVDWCRPASVLLRRGVRRASHWEDEEARRRSLVDLLRHVVTDVPFYARRFAGAGSRSASIADFPVLRKQDLSEHFADLLARDPAGRLADLRAATIVVTGGSTGSPSSYIHGGRRELEIESALLGRLYSEYGVPGTGDLLDVGLHHPNRPLIERRVVPGRYLAWNLRAADLDLAETRTQIRSVLAVVRPSLIWGMPSRLLKLAELWERPAGDGPSAVFSTHEPLSAPTREFLQERFGRPVVSAYGTAELGLCGWECRGRRLHLWSDAVIPEVLNDSDQPVGPQQLGRLVITSLKARTMPLVRFDTGDLVRLGENSPCPCGSASPWIAQLEGRSAAWLVDAEGRRHSPFAPLSAVDGLGALEVQIQQREPGKLIVVVPADTHVPLHLKKWLAESIAKATDAPFAVEVETSGRFLLAGSGKRNPVVQLLPTA